MVYTLLLENVSAYTPTEIHCTLTQLQLHTHALHSLPTTLDTRAAKAGLPPIDSLNFLPMITGVNQTSPRVEIPLSGGNSSGSGLIVGNYKLIRGKQATSFFPGVYMPNSTHDGGKSQIDCGAGCLFDIVNDPVEHYDLAKEKPDVLAVLQARAAALDKTYYQSPGEDKGDCKAFKAAQERGGYWGPWGY
eukprot:m.67212 g.67212  ORF g.67212 m.67212 type:complete len:190 (+) comp19786_c0_seq2:149-718(+)